MKAKSIFLIGLVLLTLVSATALYAETVNFGDSSFTLPEGFTINDTNDEQVALVNETSAIMVCTGKISDTEKAKQNRISMGYTFTGEENFDVDGLRINQQHYHNENLNSSVYTFSKNGKKYMIAIMSKDENPLPENINSPVTEIIHSLN